MESKLKEHVDLIRLEIELYEKLLKQNNEILLYVEKKELNFSSIERKIENKNKILNSIKEFDKKLEWLWDNWEKYKDKFLENEKNFIKKLKNLIEENLNIEKNILEKMENFIKEHKEKTLKVSKGKQAISAYKGLSFNSAYFFNKTG